MASDQLQLEEEEFPNVAHIAAQMESYPELHPRFVVPEDERFDKSSHQIIPELQPPVIDLSLMNSSTAKDRAPLEKLVADACRDDGFFQVINHGVPMELIRKLETFGYKFFSSSVEEKERFDLGFYSGYEGRHRHFSNPAPWAETFNVQISPFSNIDGLATLLSPDADSFRSLVLDCDSAMHDLGNRLLNLLERILSLEKGTYVQHFEKYTAALQIHHYPPCWHPSSALGAGPHADPSCLTILYQDSVGGLQVEKGDGKWVQLNFVPDAFVINLGDIFQAWSNGLCKSSKHRVVLNPHKSRYSIGYFYSPQFEIPICAPNELVHADNPPKYRSFTCAEYYAFRGRRRQVKRWENDLENFAGKNNNSHCLVDSA